MFFSFEGQDNHPCFVVDDTTKGKIQSDPTAIIGKVVAITGNGEAGYGTAADEPIGVVQQIEKLSTNEDKYFITVFRNRFFENISCAGSETAGDYLACDGSGGLQKSETATSCKAISVDTSKNTCTILVL